MSRPENAVKVTPMMQQYLAAKLAHPDCVVLFRMGDFYEVFYEDAQTLARELGLTLTARNKEQEEPIPMAGVPHHSAEGYIRRLVAAGYKVAICEQLEDPQAAKGLVRRGVVRVITPGVLLGDDALDGSLSNHLVALAVSSLREGDVTAVAVCDASTGELRVCELQSRDAVLAELERLRPAELLVATQHAPLFAGVQARTQAPVSVRPDTALDLDRVVRGATAGTLESDHRGQPLLALPTAALRERLRGLQDVSLRDRRAVEGAVSLILDYLVHTQGGVTPILQAPQVYRTEDFLVLDPASSANLEIFETLMGGKKAGSLFHTVDRTVTASGARRLRTWLAYPLTDPAAILERQASVSLLVERPTLRDALRAALRQTTDVQRLSARLAAGQGNARDMVALRQTLDHIPGIREAIERLDDPLLQRVASQLDPHDALRSRIAAGLVDEPPTDLREGGMIRQGFDPALDELLAISADGKSWLMAYEAQEREETGISSLKVRFNRVFGYYIEITRANLALVPDRYERRQTLAGAERYITVALKEYEDRILHAEERRNAREYELFETLRAEVVEAMARLRETADRLATLDVLVALATLSHERGYVAPILQMTRGIQIRDGRHPVVETMVEGERFVPNDTALDDEATLWVLTGPNMAGKSTIIRQVALIVLLAQIGSHVPAREATIGVVDQIFSRVGASDNLARGQSTFMVEMSETAHILRNASARSLVILDEIGRGTATYDGLSIAWAVAEHLHDAVGALTLFATHYHELTDLARTRPGVRNYNVAVKEWQDEIKFLHRLVEGPANRSYGIQVARLAGVPGGVVDRARQILSDLEADSYRAEAPARRRQAVAVPSPQLSLFEVTAPAPPPPPDPVVVALAALDIDDCSPRQAWELLRTLSEQARTSASSKDRG